MSTFWLSINQAMTREKEATEEKTFSVYKTNRQTEKGLQSQKRRNMHQITNLDKTSGKENSSVAVKIYT